MIEIRNFHHTKLKYEPFAKTVKRYVRYLKLKCDIFVSFDRRLSKADGYYRYDFYSRRHKIQLNPYTTETEIAFVKWTLISTLLHELKHAQQIERLGFDFYTSRSFRYAQDIRRVENSEYFSECEICARAYENQHIVRAVDFYNDCC